MSEGSLNHPTHHPASYRDPAGYVFRDNGVLYRQVNRSFAASFAAFEDSGAYTEFVKKGWLIPAPRTVDHIRTVPEAAFFLQPEEITFIS